MVDLRSWETDNRSTSASSPVDAREIRPASANLAFDHRERAV